MRYFQQLLAQIKNGCYSQAACNEVRIVSPYMQTTQYHIIVTMLYMVTIVTDILSCYGNTLPRIIKMLQLP